MWLICNTNKFWICPIEEALAYHWYLGIARQRLGLRWSSTAFGPRNGRSKMGTLAGFRFRGRFPKRQRAGAVQDLADIASAL